MGILRQLSVFSIMFAGSAWAAEPVEIAPSTDQAPSMEAPAQGQVHTAALGSTALKPATPRVARIEPLRPTATLVQMAGIWNSIQVATDDAGRAAVLMFVAKKYWLSTVQADALIKVLRDPKRRSTVAAALSSRIIKY